jgi:hypothetical protein
MRSQERSGRRLATRQINRWAAEFAISELGARYGTCWLAEGGEVRRRRRVVVEDVIVSGGRLIESCTTLRERGAVLPEGRSGTGRGSHRCVGVGELRNHQPRTDIPTPG